MVPLGCSGAPASAATHNIRRLACGDVAPGGRGFRCPSGDCDEFFDTAEEAAVVYARTPEARACVERLRVEAVEAMCDQLPATAAACWEQAA